MPALGRARRAAPARRAGAVHVGEMQRVRLLVAAVGAVEEFGWPAVTVGNICARARISRRTFYDLFENRDDCLLAVFDDAVQRIEAELLDGGLEGLSWRERVRSGLWVTLCFFDREPLLARLCLVHSASGGPCAVERREEIIRRLAGVVGEGADDKDDRKTGLLAEGLVGAVVAILYARLRDPGLSEPLSGLLGELMELVVLPYLGGGVARRERTRSLPPHPAAGGHAAALVGDPVSAQAGDPLRVIPMRLTYRTARVLEDVAEHPGASNRTLADRVGIADQGQVSKLLARLARLGLLQNGSQGHAKGMPNAWSLTDDGLRVLQSLRGHGRATA